MVIETIVLGDFQTNCFCVRADKKTKKCLIIDPGMEAFPLLQYLETHKLTPEVLFLTHGHVDHIAGVELLRQRWPKVKVMVHTADAEMLTDPMKNLSMQAGTMVQMRPADVLLDREKSLELVGMKFELLHTPGHTPGGVSLYSASESLVFTGDALFYGSIGRTDFEGGSYRDLVMGIKTRLLSLPDETVVYPGHGPSTTIGREKKHNSFLQPGGGNL